MKLSELIGQLVTLALSQGDLEVEVAGEYDGQCDDGDRIKGIDISYCNPEKKVRILV